LQLRTWRLRLFSFGGYGLALAALALVVFGAYDSYPISIFLQQMKRDEERGRAHACCVCNLKRVPA